MSATTSKVSSIDFGGFAGAPFTMQLMTDVGGLPGAVMETWTGLTGAAPSISTATGDGSASLVAGTHYYVVLSSTANTGWNWANTDTSDDLMAYSFNGGSTWSNFTAGQGQFRSAFRVNPSAVPEPASMAVLGIGAVALVARRRRK